MYKRRDFFLWLMFSLFCLSLQSYTIAFGSCNEQDYEQKMWKPISENKPDAWIWLGDNIYADTTDMKKMAAKYRKQLNNSEYKKFLQSGVKLFGTWDDHDYGQNDAGKEFPKKAESQQLFLDFFGVKKDDPRRSRQGVYSNHVIKNGAHSINVILLDTRYHRDQPGKNSDMLGAQQWSWLEKTLKENLSDVVIIGSSIQIIPNQHPFEKWENFPSSKKKLYDLILKHKTKNIFLLSGDRHIAEMSEQVIKNEKHQQKIYEITASGLTHAHEDELNEPNRYRYGNLFAYKNFGLMKIDWDKKQITTQIRSEKNQIAVNRMVALED